MLESTGTATHNTSPSTAIVEEKKSRDTQNLLMMQGMNDDMNQGMVTMLALFLGFMKDPSGKSFADNENVKKLFGAAGFSEEDAAYANKIGDDLRSGKTDIFSATNSLYGRIKDPKTVLSSDQARRAVSSITSSPDGAAALNLIERQKLIVATIPLAGEATNVSPETMKAVWGVESTFDKGLRSNTGAEGSWQFTDGSWNGIMRQDGHKIAQHLRENHPGYERIASEIENSLRSGNLANSGKNILSKYQYDPVVSTYASSYLMRDNAKSMGVDPSRYENKVAIYAAYNIGPQNAKQMFSMAKNGDTRSAQDVIGSTARNNPAYFRGDVSATTAIHKMTSKLDSKHDDYNRLFGGYEKMLASTGNKEEEPKIAKAEPVETTPTEKKDVGSLTAIHDKTIAAGGVIKEGIPTQPIILTAEHEKVIATGGVNEVALVAEKESAAKASEPSQQVDVANAGDTTKPPAPPPLIAMRI